LSLNFSSSVTKKNFSSSKFPLHNFFYFSCLSFVKSFPCINKFL
ncbi:unnamed protein product, partial [Brassica oleracea]